MNVLDFVLVVVVAISVITAAAKGFAYEVLMMAATVVGIALGAWEYRAVAAWLAETFHWIGTGEGGNFIAFLLLLFGVLLVAMVMGRLIRGMIHAVGLGWFDRLLGAGLGLVRGILTGAVLLLLMTAFPFNLGLVRGSRLAPDFLQGSRWIAVLMPHALTVRFDRGLNEVR